MYIKVDSLALINDFNQIWVECWLEKGYGLEYGHIPSDRYIITDSENHKVGTIEFKQYTINPHNNINKVYPFQEIEIIQNDPGSVIEIDKVAILKQYRGKNLEQLISLFIQYTEKHHIKYCVVLLERVFFKALKNVYKIPVEAVSEKKYYKGDYVIPSIIYAEKVYQRKDDFDLKEIREANSKHW
ncbi:hypothetical protein ACWV26_07570 [Rummeliibacillus sp. JY-2-4R]